MQKRLKFTLDMIHAALEKGWSVSQTARHYGTHPSSVSPAAISRALRKVEAVK